MDCCVFIKRGKYFIIILVGSNIKRNKYVNLVDNSIFREKQLMTYFNSLKEMASFIIMVFLTFAIIASIVAGIVLLTQSQWWAFVLFAPIFIFPAYGSILDKLWEILGYEL